MALSPEEFRTALGAYPTGVTVVTAIGPNGPSGATANAVASLSLDPPMMLACLDRGSRTLTSVRAQGRFGVNALLAGQEELARRFSAKNPEPEKWETVEWSESNELPRLPGALMWVACELRDLIDGGDHLILTGNVLAADSRDGQPLLFHRGAYRDLLAES
ncbi:MAG TPA: flavin reductase family protein [Solirubrobacterales bacterium]|jgi:flavin reductase (DIM6/NTAB) family NADH-FMN oxidoreductase RutF|nr:flavin reductase family protein [Solirubrobacterales bacterium]